MMRISFEVMGRLNWRKAWAEENLSGSEMIELEAYDELIGIGSRREDRRAKRHVGLLVQSDIQPEWLDYLPPMRDPPTDDLERSL